MTEKLISDFKERVDSLYATKLKRYWAYITTWDEYKSLIASLDKPEAEQEIRAVANQILREAGEKGFKLGFEAKQEAVDKEEVCTVCHKGDRYTHPYRCEKHPYTASLIVEEKKQTLEDVPSLQAVCGKACRLLSDSHCGCDLAAKIADYKNKIVEEKKPEKQTLSQFMWTNDSLVLTQDALINRISEFLERGAS